MAGFEARTTTDDGYAVVRLVGECDLAVRDQFTSAVLAALDGAPCVVIDLADLRFMDSSGIHVLVVGHQTALERGHRLYVRNAGGAVARVLALTGLDDLLRPPVDGPGRAHE
ncbi:STAS domain-containing protein [Plantactinospora siamensis]|uniref:Anti-sigma factor antagonist n=1 Tax=Plantactinospora siamensis TaxID=555372 RepID=A0ABV6NUV2_9ACTN